jgi:FkbM family methyltransferase
MTTVKRRIANLCERLTGALIISPGEVHTLPERLHLSKFFQYFGVDCVFDVGANRGQYADMLREKVGFRGHIVSFEPIPELVDELRGKARSDPHWHVEALALDRQSGLATFNVMRPLTFSSLCAPSPDQPAIFDEMNQVARQISVVRSTVAVELENYRMRLGFLRPFLKLDTQGSDSAVIEGAGDALGCFVGIQTKLAIRRFYSASVEFSEALSRLNKCGFELSAFVPNNVGHFPVLIEIDSILYRRDAIPERTMVHDHPAARRQALRMEGDSPSR